MRSFHKVNTKGSRTTLTMFFLNAEYIFCVFLSVSEHFACFASWEWVLRFILTTHGGVLKSNCYENLLKFPAK